MKGNQIFKLCLLSTPVVLASFLTISQPQKVQAQETQTINLNVLSPSLSKVIRTENLEQNQYGHYILVRTV